MIKVHFAERSSALYFRLDDSKIIESQELITTGYYLRL
ncbi:MAG: hypothetical protein RLZZ338_3342 [Cyanobacteriota bacterium]|jgi:hypothetical protein